MRSTLDELDAALAELRRFVDSILPVNEVLARKRDATIQSYLQVRRRFDYSAWVIALYGAFETFVENLVWARAQAEAGFRRYEELPVSLRAKHSRVTGELLAKARWGEGRYSGTTERDAIRFLCRCETTLPASPLNRHAIVHHEKNLRAKVVAELFKEIGLPSVGPEARKMIALRRWYADLEGLELGTVDAVPHGVPEHRLDQLVDRRNQVAHAGGPPTELLNSAEMMERTEFVAAYSQALFAVAAGDYLSRRYLETDAAGAAKRLGPVLERHRKDHVAIVPCPDHRVFVGQPIFQSPGDGNEPRGAVDRWGFVEELQINGRGVAEASAQDGDVTVGIRTGFPMRAQGTLYVLERPDELVWSPPA